MQQRLLILGNVFESVKAELIAQVKLDIQTDLDGEKLLHMPALFSTSPSIHRFGSCETGFIRAGSDIDCVLMLDVDPLMTMENRKLWQQLILTRVYKAGMTNLTNYQAFSIVQSGKTL